MSPTFASCLLFFILIVEGARGATFMLINRCGYTVWPGVLANASSTGLNTTGFELAPGTWRGFEVTSSWSGRIWGRTGCNFDAGSGQGSCATGDCRSNQVECNGAGATPPATLAEFTIASSGANNMDFYDVSLVDGYNLPMQVEAIGRIGACGSTGCAADVNRICPKELRSGDGLACRSACDAFGNPEYCCSGAYGSPSTCQPSMYSQIFKNACPTSYSYAYDDATSTFTCSGADYKITFCPSTTSGSGASSASGPPAEDSGPQNGTGDTISHFALHSKAIP
ncbi:PREDICTED: thaumatin-like protein 1b [Ipomoea nil]|uniref:thaumatin-like protein 1b n=1 Tax=Ipomoea nil TaxID=35883 RepID=UPI000901BB6A|nr:PREDICTED: thaumatin-like protein 1b [Ipomoea nil]